MSQRTKLVVSLMTVLALTTLFGCAERKSPTESDIQTHTVGWARTGNAEFHGAAVAEGLELRSNYVDFCRSCHEPDLGASTGEHCFDCHATGGEGGHPEIAVWLDPNVTGNHGEVIAALAGLEECQVCHGEDFLGNWTQVGCADCHSGGPSGHPGVTDWMNTNSALFHGTKVASQTTAACSPCHGEDFEGSWTGVDCYECHGGGRSGHPERIVWLDEADNLQSHGAAFNAEPDACAPCHGPSLSGGWAEVGCLNSICHSPSQSFVGG